MIKSFFQYFPAALLAAITSGLLGPASECRAQPAPEVDWTKALYVSPRGNDDAAGTREQPFATIQKAKSLLPSSGGGVIALLGGTYKEEVAITRRAQDTGVAERLILTAAPGEKAIFQGGEPITEWSTYNGEKGLYVVEAPDRQGVNSRTGYLDVWENSTRVRYRIQFDAAGVRAYPGSACLLDDSRILIHTRDGRDPRAVDLWRNRAANGLTILRDNVVVRGIHFENYLGGSEARAITLGNNGSGNNYRDIVVADCTIANCVRGLSMTANAPRIVNCDLRDVGLGMVTHGVDTTVENCVIQSATGAFAIGVLNQHERDGLRFYAPARGGTVTGCITAGFWAGLYIKSYTAATDARPMLIENNIFLDGIRAGTISTDSAPQPRNRYIHNIMGPNEERVDPMKDSPLKTATFEANYFFSGGGSARGSNRAGENPFVDLAGGDLSFKPGAALPSHPNAPSSVYPARPVQWSTPLSTALAQSLKTERNNADGVLRFTQPLIAASSERGAVISARLSAPAQGVLHYRKTGETAWRTMEGTDNTLSRPAVVIGAAPRPDDAPEPDYGVLFALLDGQLQADSDYEYFVEVNSQDAPLRSATQKLRTSGGPKQIVVRAGSDESKATGTEEHPFAQLQAAFDRALPGDTIRLEKGVYTAPALLAHGGTSAAPITIQGAGAEETIFDGGKEPPVLLELRDTGNIVLRDLQVRWFGNAGISATNTESVTVERCRFFNTGLRGSETPNGSGILLSNSPRWTISHCLFAKMEHGVRTTRSPQLKLLNNTAFRNMYDGIYLVESSQGSVIKGNSFTFTGNDSIVLHEPDLAALSSLVCDFNNYGAVITVREKLRPETEFKPAARYGHQGPSKAMARANIGGKLHRFSRMEDWRRFTGLDAHSIFADPQYVDPLNGDFRLMPDSPNRLPGGRTIGAAPVMAPQ